MVSSREANPEALIKTVSEKLKGTITEPVWAKFVKTGAHKERAPDQADWFFIRTAAVLRRVMIDGPVGVEKLRVHFGGRKNRGHKPERFVKGSGAVLRNVVQQLDNAGYTKKEKTGRIITSKGQSLLDKAAKELSGQVKA